IQRPRSPNDGWVQLQEVQVSQAVLPVLRDAGGVHGIVQLPPLLQQREPGEHALAGHQRGAREEPGGFRRQVQGDRETRRRRAQDG
ncbi:unnamed protein product, partial [Ectocarpus sp. 6 AP-2014]